MTTSEAFRGLFFVSDCPLGRGLPGTKERGGTKDIVGPWRDKRREDGVDKTDFRPLSLEMVERHLNGDILQNGNRAMLMPYAVDNEGRAVFTGIDLDSIEGGHKDLPQHFATFRDAGKAAKRLYAIAAEMGVDLWPETTKGGSSRVWAFHEPCPASDARDFGRLLLKRAGLHPQIEVFPKQVVATLAGNGVFMPYWGGNVPAGRQVITDPQTGEVLPAEDFARMAWAARTPAAKLSALVAEARAAGEITETKAVARRAPSDFNGDGAALDPIMWPVVLEKCAYLRGLVERAESRAELSYHDWALHLPTNLKPYGEWGRQEYHRLSRFDERYDEVQTDHKWDSLTGGPAACQTMGCERHPQDDCGLPADKKSSSHWAYKGVQLRMASKKALQEQGAPETPPLPEPEGEEAAAFDFRQTTPKDPFTLTAQGISMARGNGEKVMNVVILPHQLHIGGRTHDLDTDVESITLVWDRDGKWKRRTVPQRVVASTREIVALADASLLVNSGNARDLVAYIAHLQGEHKTVIPITRAVSSCGWKDAGGTSVFMWGTQPITSADEAPAITFVPETQESQELTTALRAGGSVEDWAAMARRLSAHPLAAFGVAASFLSPFLSDLGIPQNPILDYAGASSSGKTTVLKLAASVWGYAPENEGGLIRSWNSTAVFLERLANTCAGLPIFLDESHVAKPENVQQGLYQLANGTGKGRGAMAGGTQRTAKFRSVVFSAGEMKLTQASEHEGATARVVSFWGSPFGKGQGDLVRSLTLDALTHYGQAGPHVLRAFLAKRPEFTANMRARQKESAARLSVGDTDAIGERLIPIFAAVEAAGTFASKVLGLGWDMEAITDAAFRKATESRPVSNMQQALEQVVSWADGNPQHIAGAGYDEERPTELAGYSRADGALGLLPDRLRRLLAERRFAYESTLANWADAGWIEHDARQQRHTKVVRVLSKPMRLILLTPQAAALARGQADTEEV